MEVTSDTQSEGDLRALCHRVLALQEEERCNIARELHDQTGQSLTMIKLLVERARKAPPPQAALALSEASQEVSRIIAQVRELSLKLRPSMLDDLGLVPALTWHCQQAQAKIGAPVRLEADGLPLFPKELNTVVYRFVQEALDDLAQRAGLIQATVRLLDQGDTLLLSVEGEGCQVDSVQGGLTWMRERARLMRGSFKVEPMPGAGTRIKVALPLTPQSSS